MLIDVVNSIFNFVVMCCLILFLGYSLAAY